MIVADFMDVYMSIERNLSILERGQKRSVYFPMLHSEFMGEQKRQEPSGLAFPVVLSQKS